MKHAIEFMDLLAGTRLAMTLKKFQFSVCEPNFWGMGLLLSGPLNLNIIRLYKQDSMAIVEGIQIRQSPCRHLFHRPCLDKRWDHLVCRSCLISEEATKNIRLSEQNLLDELVVWCSSFHKADYHHVLNMAINEDLIYYVFCLFL